MGHGLATATTGPNRTAAPPEQSSARYYRPELDAIRFLAFSAVFLHHEFPARTPFLKTLQGCFAFGMCLFFFLSSFLITELLQREKARTGQVHIQAFYVRRILRIWPLYFGYLLFGYVYGLMVPATRLQSSLVLSFIFLAGNWWVASHGFPATPVGALWSISLEEQFYLIWPLLNKFGTRRTIALFSAVVLLAAMMTEFALAGTRSATMSQIWVNSFVQFQFFGLGALLSLALAGRTLTLAIPARLGLIAIALLLFFGSERIFHLINFVPRPSGAELICGYLLVGCACLLLVAAVLGMPARFIPKPMLYLGKISYGLYVFHGFCLGLSRVLVETFLRPGQTGIASGLLSSALRGSIGFTFTLILAALSYRYFESPFLKLKDRFAFVHSRTV